MSENPNDVLIDILESARRKYLKELIEDSSIPVTFRNSFKRYLLWRNEKNESNK